MIENSVNLTTDSVDAIVAETSMYGKNHQETGGFLLAPVGADAVATVAVAGKKGIHRQFDLFQISELALDRLFTFADSRNLWIPVQFHSHGFEAEMSKTDARHGLRVEGFISTIIPTFAHPSEDISEWGWWQFGEGAWRDCPAASIALGSVAQVIEFDEDGVRAR